MLFRFIAAAPFTFQTSKHMKIMITGFFLLFVLPGYSQALFTVHFDFNKHQLTTAARSSLDSFLSAEKQNLASLDLQLGGHCDAIGSDGYNDRLSKQRVAAVKKYLVEHGMQASNIGDETGYGKRKPVNENKTDEERLLNRRVTLSYSITSSKPGSLKEKIADSTVISGTNIVLKNINFVGGMHLFLPEAQPMLDELLDAMRTYPKLVVRIEGHICCHEDSGDGMDNGTGINNLSEARAQAVKDYLVANGIDEKRVSHKGFGHSAPIYPYPERSEEERIKNRRVELKIISK